MKQVRVVLEQWSKRIDEHPLHRWLVDESDGVPPEQKLWFGLYFINFIMYFRELNHYHISFAKDARQDPQRAALTAHANEDKTHSRLFMKDFQTLGWDALLGWQPSSIFHWLFSSEVSEGLRRRTSRITKLVIEATDPVVKYPVVEAIEACGNALFRHTTLAAERYRARTGKELIYWGGFHLGKETGHVKHEDVFHDVELTPEQREMALSHAVRTFELIDEQNTAMLELAQQTIREGGFGERTRKLAQPPRVAEARSGPERFDFHFWPQQPAPSQQALLARLQQRSREIQESEALRFFEYTEPQRGLELMRLVTLFMATDTTGSDTVYKYMVPYEREETVEQRAINRLSRRFGQRAKMIYADWASLGLDEALKWSPSRTLDFIYLDEMTESHRDVRAVVTHYIDAYREPVLRYWTLLALKSLTAAYGDTFKRLAQGLEKDLGLSLPYFTLRLNPDTPRLPPDAEADAVRFETLELSPRQQEVVLRLIDDIHAVMDDKLRGMVQAAQARKHLSAA